MAAHMFVSAEAALAHQAAMGLCCSGSTDLPAIEAAFRAVLDLEPRHPDASCNLGVILTRQGKYADAVEYLKRAIRVKPGHLEAQVSLADTLNLWAGSHTERGAPAEALPLAQLAVEAWPGHAEAHFTLGVANHLCGEFLRAVYLYRTALLIDMAGNTGGTDLDVTAETQNALRLPPPPPWERRLAPVLRARAWNNIGIALQAMQRLVEAEQALRTATSLTPGFIEAYSNLGLVLVDMGRLFEAEETYRTALSIAPDALQPMNNLGVLLREQGKIQDAVDLYARCVRIRGAQERNPLHNLVYALNFCPDTPPHVVQAKHVEFARLLQDHVGPPYTDWPWAADGAADGDRRITLGFVSPDFYRHSVAYFLDAPVRCLDKTRFRLVAFVNDTKADGVTQRLRPHFDAWHRITAMPSAREVAELVRAERVDILIDLTGHTAKNRLDVLALQPAPIQVTWIGYPNTTGLSPVQYRIVDAVSDPPGAGDPDTADATTDRHAEELVRVSPCFLCYTPLDGCDENGVVPLPEPAAATGTGGGVLTVGTFNAMAKISSQTVRVWARVLLANPQARVVVKSRVFTCPKTAELTRARFAAYGVHRDRVVLLAFTAGRAEHLRAYDQLDLALDCFPYSGTTTTCEALLMSVPVLTLCGRSHRQNVSASILSAAGLPELVATSEDDFVRRACELLAAPDRLARYRATIRDRFLASPMCDAERYGAEVGRAFEEMWRRRQAATAQ